jgi:hypothetical protein
MKVLLQRTDDSRFFNASGDCTDEITEALTFPNLATALFFCQNRGLFDVWLLLSGEGCPYNIPIMALSLSDVLSLGSSAQGRAA